jgi:hypothetical protein
LPSAEKVGFGVLAAKGQLLEIAEMLLVGSASEFVGLPLRCRETAQR